jgi:hypothetical protein
VPTQNARPDEVVQQHWPYDGPHSDATMASAAQAIAELVRYLNNAAWSVKLDGPGLYSVLSPLAGGLLSLDQLLGQLHAAAHSLVDDPTLYDDRRDRPGEHTAVDVADAIGDARVHQEFRLGIQTAAQYACHLGHDAPAVA